MLSKREIRRLFRPGSWGHTNKGVPYHVGNSIRGLRWMYRIGKRRSVVGLEPKLGGRLFESFETAAGSKVIQTGVVTTWDPPRCLVLEWRAVNFADSEKTEVEVEFAPSPSGTLVTVTHRGWSKLRADHPVRHGQPAPEFIRSMGLWWGDLLSSLREYAAKE